MDRYFHHYHKTFKVKTPAPVSPSRPSNPALPVCGAQDEVRRQTKVIIELGNTAQGLRELHQMSTWGARAVADCR